MKIIDPNLSTVVKILNKENIFFWIGQGSLLGIIRDNKLIDWDHDIDICVWHELNDKDKVIKAMVSGGFVYRDDLEIDNNREQLSFDKKGGRRVDINFYQKGISSDGVEIAYIKWVIPSNFFMRIIDAFSITDINTSRYEFILKKLNFLRPFFIFLKIKLIKKKLFYSYAGYQQPFELLKQFKLIDFNNMKLNIPLQSEKYLEYLYGKNWRQPKKEFSWWKVKNIKKDFK